MQRLYHYRQNCNHLIIFCCLPFEVPPRWPCPRAKPLRQVDPNHLIKKKNTWSGPLFTFFLAYLDHISGRMDGRAALNGQNCNSCMHACMQLCTFPFWLGSFLGVRQTNIVGVEQCGNQNKQAKASASPRWILSRHGHWDKRRLGRPPLTISQNTRGNCIAQGWTNYPCHTAWSHMWGLRRWSVRMWKANCFSFQSGLIWIAPPECLLVTMTRLAFQ